MTTKICKKCGIEKPLEDFPIRRANGGYDPWCKDCRNKANREYRRTHQEQFNEMRRRYYQKNINKMRQEKIAYGANHKTQKAAYDREYRQRNKAHRRKLIRNWERHSLETKIRRNLRRRLSHALNGEIKSAHTLELIGCTIEQLKHHLESLFQPGMTWENYGKFGWHIDHIQPCCFFDLSKPEEQRRCFHYTNLQPLWWHDNLVKGKKIL